MIHGDIPAALATPPGGALAVIRLTGDGCCSLVETVLSLPAGRLEGMRRHVCTLPEGMPRVSTVVLSWPRKASYTGEEMVELICHGSTAVTGAVMEALLAGGARRAGPGEFTRRALLSGRLSPLDVISLSSLWGTSGSRDETALGRLASEAASALGEAREEVEACIEFGEEALAGRREATGEAVRRAAEAAGRLLDASHAAEGPLRVFITGVVNAGKSTLFNKLAGKDIALVKSSPGTTRDGASTLVGMDGREYLIHDTAGFGGGDEDAEALALSLSMMGPSDLAVWLSPGGAAPVPEALSAAVGLVLVFSSRCDESGGPDPCLSAVTGMGMDILSDELARAAPDALASSWASAVASMTARAAEALDLCDAALCAAMLEEAAALLESGFDAAGPLGPAVERALGRMCVGK